MVQSSAAKQTRRSLLASQASAIVREHEGRKREKRGRKERLRETLAGREREREKETNTNTKASLLENVFHMEFLVFAVVEKMQLSLLLLQTHLNPNLISTEHLCIEARA